MHIVSELLTFLSRLLIWCVGVGGSDPGHLDMVDLIDPRSASFWTCFSSHSFHSVCSQLLTQGAGYFSPQSAFRRKGLNHLQHKCLISRVAFPHEWFSISRKCSYFRDSEILFDQETKRLFSVDPARG